MTVSSGFVAATFIETRPIAKILFRWLFLSSFIVTYNFSSMQRAFTSTGLTLGFYGGIAVLGWFYQILFMPETKDCTLEEIDLIFQRPTMDIVRENIASAKRTTKDLCAFRLKKVFIDKNRSVRKSVVEPNEKMGSS
jgi:hypothetical protein